MRTVPITNAKVQARILVEVGSHNSNRDLFVVGSVIDLVSTPSASDGP